MNIKHIAKIVCLFLATTILSSCNKNADEKIIPVQSGDKWGFINLKGSFVINPQFDNADCFQDGLSRVSSNGLIGYIDKKGQYVIRPQYINGTSFSEGMAFVVTDNSYPTCINNKGEVVFVLKQQCTVFTFCNGLARYKTEDERYGFVNTQGELAIPARFEYAGDFHDGLAEVKMIVGNESYSGFIDTKGELVINCQFNDASSFHDGLAAVSNGKMYGFINKKGEYTINPQFETVDDFSEGIAAFDNGKMYGFIDKNGTYVINPQFDDADEFRDGLAAVESGKLFGYIDKSGKYVINPQFDYACGFKNGLAAVRSNEKWGLIDKKGKYVVNPQFDNIRTKNGYYDCVKSTYYDANAFVSQLFGTGESLGNVLINSLNEKITLKQVAENKHFSSADIEDRTSLSYFGSDDEWHFDGEIQFSGITFHFSEPIYETYYDYYYNNSSKSFQWGAKLAYATASFSLHGNAIGKGAAITSTSLEKIKSVLTVTDEKTFEQGVCGFIADKKNGIILSYDNNRFFVVVTTIGKAEFDRLCNNIMANNDVITSLQYETRNKAAEVTDETIYENVTDETIYYVE